WAVALVSAGTYAVEVAFAGNSNYNVSSNTKTITVGKANQSPLSVSGPTSGVYGDLLVMSASGGSTSGAVTFTVNSGSTACVISGGLLHITSGTGSCSITAHKAGDSNYNPVDSASSLVSIARANQSITFAALANKTYGDADFDPGAAASSGLAVKCG